VDVTTVLVHILFVVVAAKLAAEVSARLSIPAVVGEILAGVLIGPSALGLVPHDQVIRVLGELGVILLLLDVGMEMDLAELGAVGRASLSVATVGVVVPFVTGAGAGLAMGMTGKEAIFVGAALTATSVGITARVFGDLRALASVEARTVLGAAVADDVMGLVILTVVVRAVSEGSISVVSLLGIVGVAVGFLVVAGVIGTRFGPPVFALVARHSRSSGTLLGLALAFTLGVAKLADVAKLAPIVGAFVAGLALSRSQVTGRIRRELSPVAQLFIPVFFLQIGIDADIERFWDGKVIGIAAVLLVIAVAGKLASAVGMAGSPGDRLLVGIGMIPRGEVGLIFATLGLREHIFGQDTYASLLLVVLATTLLTPPLLRSRLLSMRARRQAGRPVGDGRGEGWLRVVEGRGGPVLELTAEPPDDLALALRAVSLCDNARPSQAVLDWLSETPQPPVRWTPHAREWLFTLLESGSARTWRLLTLTGLLERALPELGEGLARRHSDASELDPIGALRWPRLSRLRDQAALGVLTHPDRVLLAAAVLDVTDDSSSDQRSAISRRIATRLGLDAESVDAIGELTADAELLPAAIRRADAFSEEAVLQLAAHLEPAREASAVFALARAGEDVDAEDRAKLAELEDLVLSAMRRPDLLGGAVDERRSRARLVAVSQNVRERIDKAPRAYVLAVGPEDLAAQAALCEPPPSADAVRVMVTANGAPHHWRISLVAHDRAGLLAAESSVFVKRELDVTSATVATWRDGCALGTFTVLASDKPDADELEAEIVAELRTPQTPIAVPDAALDFDNLASPWHTICTVRAPDRRGLLHSLTAGFAATGVSVHSARLAIEGTDVVDVFELSDRHGHKLSDATIDATRVLFATGEAPAQRRRWLRRLSFA
jgi:Kef-type K+ transport system membrane component KefB